MAEKDTPTSSTENDLNLFYEVSTSIHAICDLDEMLRSILHKIKTVFHVEGGSIALHDADRKEFYFIRTVEEETDGDTVKMQRCGSRSSGCCGMGIQRKPASDRS